MYFQASITMVFNASEVSKMVKSGKNTLKFKQSEVVCAAWKSPVISIICSVWILETGKCWQAHCSPIERIERYWKILRKIERYWDILGDIERYREILKVIESNWELLRNIEGYWILRAIERHGKILRDIERYWEILRDIDRLQNR